MVTFRSPLIFLTVLAAFECGVTYGRRAQIKLDGINEEDLIDQLYLLRQNARSAGNEADEDIGIKAAPMIPRRPTFSPTTSKAPSTTQLPTTSATQPTTQSSTEPATTKALITAKQITLSPTNETRTVPIPSPYKSGYCATWGRDAYQTFDGVHYMYKGECTYKLVSDCFSSMFDVYVHNDGDCEYPECRRSITVDTTGNPKNGVFLTVEDDGRVSVTKGDQSLVLPTFVDGLLIENVAHYVFVRSSLGGFRIVWDAREYIGVSVTADHWDHTCGLCGRYNNDPSDDFTDSSGHVQSDPYFFAESWKVFLEDEGCEAAPALPPVCTSVYIPPSYRDQYQEFVQHQAYVTTTCSQLQQPPFDQCHSTVDPQPYIDACEHETCNCNETQSSCPCDNFEAYARECERHGVTLDWRTDQLCPITCESGLVYDHCGTSCPQTCLQKQPICEEDFCVDGCRCPDGTYLQDGQCVPLSECTCTYQGEEYAPGAVLSQDCNECICHNGKWDLCTANQCDGICSIWGDPHFETFDGKKYNFHGDCTYVVVENCFDATSDYKIIGETAQCSQIEGRTCLASLHIHVGASHVKLKKNHQVYVDGDDVTSFPHDVDGDVLIEKVTSVYLKATLHNGLQVLWDGDSRAYITATADHANNTCGLCGTFNNNQLDDFYTKQGDIEVNPADFGNKWKADQTCTNVPSSDPVTLNPCDVFSQNAFQAEQTCSRMQTDPIFQACHSVLHPVTYIHSCLQDFCKCEDNTCHCDAFAHYAHDCGQRGVVIDWRPSTPDCGLNCDTGKVYEPCANSCATTCPADTDAYDDCQPQCVEGCVCPNGMLLDPHDRCIPKDQCPCTHNGQLYYDGDVLSKMCETCICDDGSWNCDGAECPTGLTCPPNMEYTDCLSECQQTCSNYATYEGCTPAECEPGCQCSAGFVWNGLDCVLPSECPCLHGGKEYQPGETIKLDCNTCTCQGTQGWQCQQHSCAGQCSVFGDPHFETYDGKEYEFQGECAYYVSRSQDNNAQKFAVIAENIPCGTSAVTCSKSITFTIGSGNNTHIIHLIRGSEPIVQPRSEDVFLISDIGLYTFVHTAIGVTLQWDRGTRFYIRLDHSHQNLVEGLCGNFNGNQNDDFLGPSGGFSYVDPDMFGNSWKVHDYCSDAPVILNPCEMNPHRRTWAKKQCSVLKSELFQPCHAEVPFEPYLEDCEYDACGCDMGGDCECLCTAIAAYAHECNRHGVPIKWRSQELCPIQCTGDCWEYKPCIPLCEYSCEHTDRRDENNECEDTCVEGCACPDDFKWDGEKCVAECPTTIAPTGPTTQTPSTTEGPIATSTPVAPKTTVAGTTPAAEVTTTASTTREVTSTAAITSEAAITTPEVASTIAATTAEIVGTTTPEVASTAATTTPMTEVASTAATTPEAVTTVTATSIASTMATPEATTVEKPATSTESETPSPGTTQSTCPTCPTISAGCPDDQELRWDDSGCCPIPICVNPTSTMGATTASQRQTTGATTHPERPGTIGYTQPTEPGATTQPERPGTGAYTPPIETTTLGVPPGETKLPKTPPEMTTPHVTQEATTAEQERTTKPSECSCPPAPTCPPGYVERPIYENGDDCCPFYFICEPRCPPVCPEPPTCPPGTTLITEPSECCDQYECVPGPLPGTTISQTPPEVTTSQSPPEVTTSQSPPEVTTSQAPPEVTTSQTPPEVTTSQAPPEVTTSQAPPEVTTSQSPPVVTTSQAPPEVTTSLAPPEVTTSQLPPEVTTSQAPPEVTTSQSPPEVTTSQSPPEVTTSQAPPEVTTSQAPPEITTSQAPPEVTTSQAPPEMTTSQAPEMTTTPKVTQASTTEGQETTKPPECSCPPAPTCPPGYVERPVYENGDHCCPYYFICQPRCPLVCPEPPTCPPGSTLITEPSECCDQYECVPETTTSRAPPEVTTSQSPPEVTTSQAPPEVTTSQAPPEVTTSQAPPEVTTSQAPPEVTTSQAPEMTTTPKVTQEATTAKREETTKPPECSCPPAPSCPPGYVERPVYENGDHCCPYYFICQPQMPTTVPSTGRTTSQTPPEITTSQAPPEVTTSQAPPEVTTSQSPPEVTTSQAPPEVTTSQAPPKVTTSQSPPEVTTSQVPPEVTTSQAPPEVTTSQAPPEVTTSQAPPEGTTSQAPPVPEITSSQAPPEITTSQVPPETTPHLTQEATTAEQEKTTQPSVCSCPPAPTCPPGYATQPFYENDGDCCPFYFLCEPRCPTECPVLEPPTCPPGSTPRKVTKECCDEYECVPEAGKCVAVPVTNEHIVIDDCVSQDPVEMTECDGRCSSRSYWSYDAQETVSDCSCCSAMATETRLVPMICADNTTTLYQYTHITACGCIECGANIL